MSDLFDLPYSKVIDIYNEYQIADTNNDIVARTRLLKRYPQIFTEEAREEIKAVTKQAGEIMQRYKKGPLDLTPHLFK